MTAGVWRGERVVDERWGHDTEGKGKVTAGVWRERGWWMRGGQEMGSVIQRTKGR